MKRNRKVREAELAYLRDRLGHIPADAKPIRSESTLNVPLRLGPNPNTEVGREDARVRKGFLPWLRKQPERGDDIGDLARALARHEAEPDASPPDSWVKVASRITRGEIGAPIGKARLRAALDTARTEFVALPEEKEQRPSEFRAAAE